LKQHIVRIALGLLFAAVFLGHAGRLHEIGFITGLDSFIYDARLRFTMPGTVDQRIVILDIDEKSLAVPELGRWPWSRDRLSALVDKLFDKYGVAVLGFDVVFAEPDQSSGLKVLDALEKKELRDVPQFRSSLEALRPRLDNDAIFARAIKGRPVVLGYYFSSAADALESGALPEPVLPAGTFAGRSIAFTSWRGYGANLPALQASAAGAGHFNPFVDPDGVSRRVPMLAEYKDKYYESLSLSMLRLLVGLQDAQDNNSAHSIKLPGVQPGYGRGTGGKDYSGLEWLQVGPVRIPVDDTVSALIPYRGPRGSYQYISLSDIYFDKVPVESLRGKIALVGTSAPGLLDLRSSPVGEVYPGVEIHANMISGMLDGTIKQKPPYMLGAEVALILIGGVVLSALLPFLGPLKSTLFSALALLLVAGLNVLVWSEWGTMLPLASSVLMIAALFALNMSYGYFIESRSKRQFTELFGQYVPPELVDKMAEDPEKYNMEPRKAELTILFCDVRGFTTISEALKPDELREYINDYLTDMSAIIRSKHRGTLDKYIGDAIMAFWGAPVEDAGHAKNGLLAALEMQRECRALNVRFESRNWPKLKIGIGLNTGNVRVGDMGSQVRRAYTVMGDAVNVASRLEGRTKYYGVGILVGEATRAAVKEIVFREIDRVRVKGKADALTIFEPICLETELDEKLREELKLWQGTLRAYRAQQWDQAELNLIKLRRMNPECHLYELYADRVAGNRRDPVPAGWDGVTAFNEK